MTSVGPGSSIQRSCSSAMASVVTAMIDSSAAGLTRMAARACRATETISSASTGTPDSLLTSIDTPPRIVTPRSRPVDAWRVRRSRMAHDPQLGGQRRLRRGAVPPADVGRAGAGAGGGAPAGAGARQRALVLAGRRHRPATSSRSASCRRSSRSPTAPSRSRRALRYGELVARCTRPGSRCPTSARCRTSGRRGLRDRHPRLRRRQPDPRRVGVRGRAGGRVGELRTVRRGDPGFAGAVVALGALGVVTRLTLDLVRPSTCGRPSCEGLPRPYDDVPEALAAAYSVSLFTYFAGAGFEQVWLKQRADEPALPRAGWARQPADGPRHMVRGVDPASCTPQLGSTGPWYDAAAALPAGLHPEQRRRAAVGVPRAARGGGARAARRSTRSRDRIAPVLHVAEVRTIAADDQWLIRRLRPRQRGPALHLDLRRGGGATGRRRGRGGVGRRRRAPALGQGVQHAAGAAAAAVAPPGRLRRGRPKLPTPTGKFRNAFLDRHLPT